MNAVEATDADVLVVGAGPAGSATAALLAGAGLRVRLVDKASVPPPKVCGEYLSPGCVPLLDRLGALASLWDAGARPLQGMLIHTAGGRTLRATYPTDGMGRVAGLSVARSVLDRLLLDLAITRGAVFEPQVQVSDVVWEAGRIVGIRGRQRGQWMTRRAALIVGADGRHSVVAARLGGTQPHPRLDRMAIVAYLTGVPRAEANGEVFLGRNRYGIINPIAPGLTNLGLVVGRDALERGEDPRYAWRRIAESIPGLADRLALAQTVGPVRALGPLAHRAVRLSAPGALLVGDAAGFLDPFTGEGIYAALRSAELAAAAILYAWTHQPAAPDVEAYARAWDREFRPKWRFAAWLQLAIRRPRLAEGLVAYLARRPVRAAAVMAAAGDLRPSSDLGLGRLLFGCVGRVR